MSGARLDLPEVTLCAVDTRSPALALRALAHCTRQIHFGRALLLTEGRVTTPMPEGIECVDIGPIHSAAEYSSFVLGRLLDWVATSHVLIVQWDGFVADASCWEPAFLEVDYLGAPWGKARHGHWVGNGGFSLRSRRLLQALQQPALRPHWHHPEDLCIAQTLRGVLEAEHGIVFGSLAQARRFAFENEQPPGPTFGFHGLFNLHRVLTPQACAEVLAQLPDGVVSSRDGFKTARALLRGGHGGLARLLLERRMALGQTDLRTLWLAWRAGQARR